MRVVQLKKPSRHVQNYTNLSVVQFELQNYNRLARLQLREGIPNQEKPGKDVECWFSEIHFDKTEQRDFQRNDQLPVVDLRPANFPFLVWGRTALMRPESKHLLTLGESCLEAER